VAFDRLESDKDDEEKGRSIETVEDLHKAEIMDSIYGVIDTTDNHLPIE
jgi:hypothetical protein